MLSTGDLDKLSRDINVARSIVDPLHSVPSTIMLIVSITIDTVTLIACMACPFSEILSHVSLYHSSLYSFWYTNVESPESGYRRTK